MPPPRQHISERRCTDLSISYLRSLNEVSSFASRINPSAAEAFNQLGNLAMARQDYAEAVRQFKKACQLEPRMTAYQLNLKTAEGSAEK